MITPAGIRLEGVSKSYETEGGTVNALVEVSLEVEPGRSLAVTGPSGCGKSTLLGIVAGLEAPTAGTASVGGRSISSLGQGECARLRREQYGLVFQADNLLPYLTALENVALQSAMQPGPVKHERCVSMLARLALAGEADKLPDQLSGGQRQRVALARALVHSPRVLLADEPTGSLDSASSEVVLDLLIAAQRESSTTLIVVTHDAAVARRLDRTVRLREGRLVGADRSPDGADAGA